MHIPISTILFVTFYILGTQTKAHTHTHTHDGIIINFFIIGGIN